MSEQPTVAFFPEPGAWGPTNNLVAVGNHLRERGIRVCLLGCTRSMRVIASSRRFVTQTLPARALRG